MRTITNIVIHCTATPQTTTVESIKSYWKNSLKWANSGYHHIIEANGNIVNLQPIEKPSNGVSGHNANSIHISYIGGVDGKGKPIDNRTAAQKESLVRLIYRYKMMFPNAKIKGHRDFGVPKDCPSFSVSDWMEELRGMFN